MLDERKAAILTAVVQEYIETAQPVGSGRVARAPGVGVSSATVRNEMATLEEDGYLVQPHTSAGRVPTEKGYRLFVDAIEPPQTLTGARAQQVRDFFRAAHGELEQTLASTSRLLSTLTDWTGVVVAPEHGESTVRSVQLVALAPATVLAVVVLSDGGVEKHTLELEGEVSEARVAAASAHLARCLDGLRRGAVPEAAPATGDAQTDDLASLVLSTLNRPSQAASSEVFVGGVSRVAQAFDAVETVKEVLGILEQQYLVVTLLKDVLDRGLQVAIGSETGIAPLAECALVVAPYELDGEQLGSIGVLGPTRMNYPEAMAAVAAVSRRLGHRLEEG